MKRVWLTEARLRKHWTLEQAAEHLQVDMNTVLRWEQGRTTPHLYNVEQLCQVYGATAADLGLGPEPPAPPASAFLSASTSPSPPAGPPDELVMRLGAQDLTLRLLTLVLSWSHRNTRYDELQWLILHETEDAYTMTPTQEDSVSRREALRRLALLPIELYGLSAASAVLKKPAKSSVEELLTQCAAGLVACQYFSRGQYDEMQLAEAVISSYLPALQAIVQTSTKYRHAAAGLTAQAQWLKSRLIVHALGPGHAIRDAEQAVIYSKESGNLSLQLSSLANASWIYYLNKQRLQALNGMLAAEQLLKESSQPLTALVQSDIYGCLAQYQAQAGYHDQAVTALGQMHEYFFVPANNANQQMYTDFNRSTLILDEGLTYYHLGQHEQAFSSFAQVIEPETLTGKMPPSSERVRIEILNHQALASLKRRKKDRELSIKLWKAGIQGAIALKSEQRFAEAHTAYEIMESLWGGDKPVDDLRELLNHW